MKLLKGIIPAIITPINNGVVNKKGLSEIIENILKNPVGGIFALGTTGEFFSLSDDIKRIMIKHTVEIVGKRVPVIVGAGAISTNKTIEYCNMAYDNGADYVSIITPYFLKFSEYELLNHYKFVAKESKLPIIIYNIPQRTGNSLSADLVAEVSKIDNIIGIKDSSGKIENIKKYIEKSKIGFLVFAGTDSLILKTLKLGGAGAVAATGNLIPSVLCDLETEFNAGNFDKCKVLQLKINQIREIFTLGTVPAPIKAALEILGFDAGEPNLPVAKISDDKYIVISNIIKSILGDEI